MLKLSLKKTTFLLYTTYIFTSCSVQKEIAKSAKADVLDDKALQAAHVGISIYEPATNKYWFNYQGDKYFVPASNTKIPTCYAAMKYLGDSLVGLRYQIVNPDAIIIHPTGDPTFLHPDYVSQPGYIFLKRYREILLHLNSLFPSLGNGWSWNDYMESYLTPRSEMPIYGNLLRVKWVSSDSCSFSPGYFYRKTRKTRSYTNGFDLSRSIGQNDFSLFSGSRKSISTPFETDPMTLIDLLADTLKTGDINFNFDFKDYPKESTILHSQPTDSLLKPMMHRSDNFFAEQSLLMVSNEKLGAMNDARIIDTLLKTDFKDLPQKPRWTDGSGLSRYNLFTPQDFVVILNKMRNEFGMERIKVILPTGGEGTISNYYKTDSGYIYGKTGTLSGVVAFSGYLYTKKGKLLIFSTLVNNHQASATDIRRAIEKFLQKIRANY